MDTANAVVMTGRRNHANLYVMFSTPTDHVNFSAVTDDAKLWH